MTNSSFAVAIAVGLAITWPLLFRLVAEVFKLVSLRLKLRRQRKAQLANGRVADRYQPINTSGKQGPAPYVDLNQLEEQRRKDAVRKPTVEETAAELRKIHERVAALPRYKQPLVFKKEQSPKLSRTEHEKNPNRGWVYVIGHDGSDHLKIGKSKNGVDSRIRTWQTGSPFKFIKHLEIEVSNMHRLETDTHRFLRKHHVKGEWFDAPVEKVINALKNVMTRQDIVVLNERLNNPELKSLEAIE